MRDFTISSTEVRFSVVAYFKNFFCQQSTYEKKATKFTKIPYSHTRH